VCVCVCGGGGVPSPPPPFLGVNSLRITGRVLIFFMTDAPSCETQQIISWPGGRCCHTASQVYRFYYRCKNCAAEFTMKTDPASNDYQLEQGATRNYESWRESAQA
jgi:hypothetical protein